MKKIFSTLLIAAALLGCGQCDHDVACKRQQAAPFQSRPAEKHVCFIDHFPVSNPKPERIAFSVDYAKPSEIKEVHFAPSTGHYRRDDASDVNYIPSQIFIDFPNLAELRMSTNLIELTSGDFIHAMNLTKLNLHDNHLKIIKNNVFSPLSMRSNTNEITRKPDDDVFPLHKLRELKLPRNDISEIVPNSFNGLSNLVELSLASNKLTVIRQGTLAGLPSLLYLIMNSNQIETIEDGALDLPALVRLDLATNKLKRLSDAAFERLPKLEVVELHQNDLEHLGQSLYRLPNVYEISLNWNQIEDIDLVAFAKMPKLEELDLTGSGFTFATLKIDDNQHWNSPLSRLHLNANNLSDPTELNKLRIFPNLEYLALGGNEFKDLEIGENRTLKDILPSLNTITLGQMRATPFELSEIERSLMPHASRIPRK